MKKMLLASAAVLALMAVTPALAKGKDVITGQTGWKNGVASGDQKGGGSSGGRHDQSNSGDHHDHGGSAASSSKGVSVRPSGIATGAHFRADSTARTGGSGHHDHGTGLRHQSGGDDNSGIIQRDTGKTASPATGGSNMSQGSGGRHFRNNDSTISEGSGGRHGNPAIIFGIGGHGYKTTVQFGHSRHNSAFDALRRAYHTKHHYHGGSYNRPNGWYYHTWNYGDFLPALFFDQQYFIGDYDNYGLVDPPDGTVWVRYGNDALLVDQDTGEIIRVEYGLFY